LRVEVIGEAMREARFGRSFTLPENVLPDERFLPRATNINLSVNVSGRESRHLEWRLGDPYEYQQVIEL
jgi:hypothetical protein